MLLGLKVVDGNIVFSHITKGSIFRRFNNLINEIGERLTEFPDCK
jgi:hypothetical protein